MKKILVLLFLNALTLSFHTVFAMKNTEYEENRIEVWNEKDCVVCETKYDKECPLCGEFEDSSCCYKPEKLFVGIKYYCYSNGITRHVNSLVCNSPNPVQSKKYQPVEDQKYNERMRMTESYISRNSKKLPNIIKWAAEPMKKSTGPTLWNYGMEYMVWGDEREKRFIHNLEYETCKECPWCDKEFNLDIHYPIKFLCGFPCCLECLKIKPNVSCFICYEVCTQQYLNKKIYEAEEAIRVWKELNKK